MKYEDAVDRVAATDFDNEYEQRNTYWNHKGMFQDLQNKLVDLIPIEGECEKRYSTNRALEKYRKANNCAYDLYNNGLCNRAASFTKVFGFSGLKYRTGIKRRFDTEVYVRMEQQFNYILLKAAKEQGLIE